LPRNRSRSWLTFRGASFSTCANSSRTRLISLYLSVPDGAPYAPWATARNWGAFAGFVARLCSTVVSMALSPNLALRTHGPVHAVILTLGQFRCRIIDSVAWSRAVMWIRFNQAAGIRAVQRCSDRPPVGAKINWRINHEIDQISCSGAGGIGHYWRR
jgi:hypothetical protein